jgi:predicted secreted protein
MPFSIPVGGGFFDHWFTVLFAVLPLGVRSQQETGDIAAGTDPGAPVGHGLSARLHGQL